MYFSVHTPTPEEKEIVRVDGRGNVTVNPEATPDEVKVALIHVMAKLVR